MTLHQLLPLGALVLNLVLAVLAAARHTAGPLHRPFIACAGALAVWNLGVFQLRHAADADAAAFWETVIHAGVVAVPALYVHLVLSFLGETVARRRALAAVYGTAAVFFLLNATGSPLFIRGVVRTAWGWAPAAGPLYALFVVVFNALVIGGTGYLARRSRRMASSFRRNRARLIVVGAIVSLAGGTVDFARFLLAPLIPAAEWMYPLGIPANMLFALALGFAIVRYRLFDVHVVVARVALAVAAGMMVGTAIVVGAPAAPPWVVATAALLAGALTSPLARRVDNALHRLVLSRSRGCHDTLIALSRRMSTLLDPAPLVDTLVRGLVDQGPLTHAALLLHDAEAGTFVAAGQAAYGGEHAAPASIPADGAVVQLLAGRDGVLVVEEARLRRPSAELAALDAALVVPLRRDRELAGILLVGEKRSGGIFTTDEREVLAVLASQAAVALENARLHRSARTAYDELSRTQSRLAQAQKMEAIGRLAGGIAHDFNNLLTVITGRADLALEAMADGHPAQRDVALIEKAAQRASRLTRQLLTFSRRQPIQPRVLDVDQLVADLMPMLRRFIGEPIVLTVVPGTEPAYVHADPGQLEQVIANLVVNARDAMPQGGQITIETSPLVLPADGAEAPAGAYVVLAVSDSGVGMDAETQARMFEPFFTTKAVGDGPGLGLAIVYGIVQQSHGHIAVASTPGRGTRIEVRLPATTPAAASGELAGEAPSRGSETVLLVEDQADIRALAADVLRRRGYTVLEARDGVEALAVSESHAGAIDLVLTDVVMPGMQGPEVAQHVRRRRPAVRTLFMSGYAESTAIAGALGNGALLLHKPFTPGVLTARVRDTLDAAPSSDSG